MASKQHDFYFQTIIILLTSSQDVGGKQERFSVFTALTGGGSINGTLTLSMYLRILAIFSSKKVANLSLKSPLESSGKAWSIFLISCDSTWKAVRWSAPANFSL